MTSTPNYPVTLDDAKVGDTVMLVGGGPRSEAHPVVVAHATPKQLTIINEHGAKFWRADGRKIGERYGSRIRPVVPGELEAKAARDEAQALIWKIAAVVAPQSGEQRQRNHARLVTLGAERLAQVLDLLTDGADS